MKILLTVHQFFPQYASGTEVLTYSVARELIVRGHDVRILTSYPTEREMKDEDRFDEYEFEGIPVYRFHHSYTPMAGQTSMLELSYDNKLAASYFQWILGSFDPDLVHFFHLNRLGSGLIEHAVLAGVPAFMTPTDFWAVCHTSQLVLCDGQLCHGPSSNSGNCVKHLVQMTQSGLARKVAERLPIAAADLLVRFSQTDLLPSYPFKFELKAIGRRLGTNVGRMNKLRKIVAPNRFMIEMLTRHGVSPGLIIESAYGIDVVQAGSALRETPRQPLRIGFIGTLLKHKGCHVLINAFKLLQPGRAILKIYGDMKNSPEYSSELRRLAGHNGAIEFCGVFPNAEISEVLADLDVLVVPSLWYENTPLVVYSSQDARCPVVASNFPGISEFIRDEDNGLLFEAGNAAALATQLFRLVQEPGLLKRLSSNSRQPKSTVSYVDELLNIWTAD